MNTPLDSHATLVSRILVSPLQIHMGAHDNMNAPQESQQLSQHFNVPATPYSTGTPMASFDDETIRMNWKEGDFVEVFSNTNQIWIQGFIHSIGHDICGEFIDVHYFDEISKKRSKKRLQRFDEDVRPILEDAQYQERNVHWPKIIKEEMQDTPETRKKWVQGDLIEVYSRSKERWFI